jgi:phenylpropionate dioxygenase-like ring-hydroxylating dioxygenase large terminal subunit
MTQPTRDTAELAADLDRGLSLPASWYTDPAVLDLERERIFRRSWQYVGHVQQVAAVGDFFTASVGDIPVVIVRGDAGVNAFVNVCRHRRHEVMSGAGNRKALQCPYHAWTYDLDGCLTAAPRSEDEAGFRREDFPLLPLRLETWGPLLFVNPEPDAQSLAGVLGELPEIVGRTGIDLNRLVRWGRREWRAEANWKVMLENYLECYHCPVRHKGFSQVVDVREEAYSLRAGRWSFSQVAPVRAAALDGSQATAYDARGEVTQAQYHLLWPNFTLNINPGFPNLSLDVWIPDGPESSRGFSEHYFAPGVSEAFAKDLIAFSRQVGAEDDALTTSVQRGLRAGLPAQGRFLHGSEHLVIRFQKLVLAALS